MVLTFQPMLKFYPRLKYGGKRAASLPMLPLQSHLLTLAATSPCPCPCPPPPPPFTHIVPLKHD